MANRTVPEIWERAERTSSASVLENKKLRKLRKTVREAEKKSKTGATGYVLLRFIAKPIARLVDEKKIGPAEYMAAQEFFTAFNTITGGLWIKPQSLERRDPSYGSRESLAIIEAQHHYRRFVDYWSGRAKAGDKTLAILVAAVVDERPFHVIEADLTIRHGKARQATIGGLRDYAARAGFVSREVAASWIEEAARTFTVIPPALSLASARARVANY